MSMLITGDTNASARTSWGQSEQAVNREKEMSCCGKIKKGLNIAQGNLAVILDKINLLPPNGFLYHSIRLRACRGCQHHTYLTEEQYLDWINDNGGIEKFIAEIDTLESWPALPVVQDNKPNAKLFCSLCKCWLPAKSYVKREKCPVDHPDWKKPKCFFKESS